MKIKLAMLVLMLLSLISLPILVFADMFTPASMNVDVTLDGKKITEDSPRAMLLFCLEKNSKLDDSYYNGYYSDFFSTVPKLVIDEYSEKDKCYWQPSILANSGYKNSSFSARLVLPPGSELVKSNFKLAVYLPTQDKIYISPETTRDSFRSSYQANLLSSNRTIEIKDTTTFWKTPQAHEIKNLIFALVLTQIIELLVALIYLSSNKLSKKILFSVFILNLISLPIVWFIASLFKTDLLFLAIVVGEVFAFTFEAYLIHFLNKKVLSLGQSFILSLIMNAASFVIGGFILGITTIVFYL